MSISLMYRIYADRYTFDIRCVYDRHCIDIYIMYNRLFAHSLKDGGHLGSFMCVAARALTAQSGKHTSHGAIRW